MDQVRVDDEPGIGAEGWPPCPFPLELPARLIQLYTFAGDVVLDPFMGSGTTALAAPQAGRRYVGYDTSAEYVALAQQRLKPDQCPAVRMPVRTDYTVKRQTSNKQRG